ncbi:hypothetical protein ES288_D03G089200v1 [Gossypium darwinii]|uniref:THH1/TOM1/TOM3 domain-containing protein n=1 Tax=Gossypium darwinii TaxID=34276 RepID=A0A5D2D405_GOSDA|nr:hypothetical protein ES288_D03G089200v1 [Gossypium darwinii]
MYLYVIFFYNFTRRRHVKQLLSLRHHRCISASFHLSMAGIATTCYYLTLSSTRDDEDDTVAKMKAVEEALDAKQKVTNSLSATCSFFFIMFYNFVTNCSWYSEDIYAKLPYDSIVFILHGCTMYFLTSLINFMCGV